MKKTEYKKGRIVGILAFISQKYGINHAELGEAVNDQFPALRDPSQCAHCGANMAMEVYTAAMHDALLVWKMAQVIRHAERKGKSFEEANKVHTPTLEATDAVRHQTTIASYLDLIEQPKEWRNSGFWRLTPTGQSLIRGARVPKTAKVFRGDVIERGQETTSLSEMFQTHREKVERALARRKEVEKDYRADIREYNPIEWSDFGGYATGNLFDPAPPPARLPYKD